MFQNSKGFCISNKLFQNIWCKTRDKLEMYGQTRRKGFISKEEQNLEPLIGLFSLTQELCIRYLL